MTKARTNDVADSAADAFNRTVDTLVMKKLQLPELASGITAASDAAVNVIGGKNSSEIIR